MPNVKHAQFEEVRGYATYANAQKRGEEVAARLTTYGANTPMVCRWVVVALPTGRFAPCFIVNNTVPGGPGFFIGERNVLVIN